MTLSFPKTAASYIHDPCPTSAAMSSCFAVMIFVASCDRPTINVTGVLFKGHICHATALYPRGQKTSFFNYGSQLLYRYRIKLPIHKQKAALRLLSTPPFIIKYRHAPGSHKDGGSALETKLRHAFGAPAFFSRPRITARRNLHISRI